MFTLHLFLCWSSIKYSSALSSTAAASCLRWHASVSFKCTYTMHKHGTRVKKKRSYFYRRGPTENVDNVDFQYVLFVTTLQIQSNVCFHWHEAEHPFISMQYRATSAVKKKIPRPLLVIYYRLLHLTISREEKTSQAGKRNTQ